MRKGQVTIFVIVGLIIIAAIAVLIVFRDSIFGDNIPASLAPVYSRYSECISEEAKNGISLMQSQGGRLNIGQVGRASEFSPFSTHLNFLGLEIPYWYGFTNNNLVIENVPTTNEMENDLAAFIQSRVNDCDFSDFYTQGYIIEKGEASASVSIEDNVVNVKVNSPLSVTFGEDSARKVNHESSLDSKLGLLHNSAIEIYNKERSSLFLENYALDVVESYAPVDGVEIQCSPKIWKTNEIVSGIQEGLSANLASIGFNGQSNAYYSQDLGINENVNIMYLPDKFPSKLEITPATQATMVAEPVGTQEGMGIMGFCYVPYHFIYDLRFPVLIQIGDGIDNFQFPMVVDIDNNLVSNGNTKAFVDEEQDVDICSFAENEATIQTYDTMLNPVAANISYKCFDSVCSLGSSSLASGTASLTTHLPACVNGEIIATADGYAESRVTFSSNSENLAQVILEREYPVEIEVKLGGHTLTNSTAVVHFITMLHSFQMHQTVDK
jgi:hypothetical protein